MKENETNNGTMQTRMLFFARVVYRRAYDCTLNRSKSMDAAINLYRKSGLFHLDQNIYNALKNDEIAGLKDISARLRKMEPSKREKVLKEYQSTTTEDLMEYYYTERAYKTAESLRNSSDKKDRELCRNLDKCAIKITDKVDRADDEYYDSKTYELAKEGLIIMAVSKKYVKLNLLEKFLKKEGADKLDIFSKSSRESEYDQMIEKAYDEMYWSESGNYRVGLESWCILLDEHKEKIIEFSEKLKKLTADERWEVLDFIRRNIYNKYETEEAANARRSVIKGILDEDKMQEAMEIFESVCRRMVEVFKSMNYDDFDCFRIFDKNGKWNIKFKYGDFYSKVKDFHNDVERIQNLLQDLNGTELTKILYRFNEFVSLTEKEYFVQKAKEEKEKKEVVCEQAEERVEENNNVECDRDAVNEVKKYRQRCINIVKKFNGIIDKTVLLKELQNSISHEDAKKTIKVFLKNIDVDREVEEIDFDGAIRGFSRLIVQDVCQTVCLEWHNLVMTHAGYKRIVKIVTQIQAQQNAAQLGVDLDVGLRRWPNQWLQ